LRKKNERVLALLLALAVVFSGMPAISFAADDEPVLSSITWSGQDSSEIQGTNIEVEVPYTYGTTFNAGSPSSYVKNSAKNPEGGDLYTDISIAGDPITLAAQAGTAGNGTITVSYTYNETNTSAVSSVTDYAVTVTRAARENPTFSGTLNIRRAFSTGYTFSASDFTGLYDANDGGALQNIAISGGSAGVTLKYDGADYVEDTLIPLTGISAGKLKAEAASAGTAAYTAVAYEAGDATTPYGGVTLNVAMLTNMTIPTVSAGTISQLATTPLAMPKNDMNDELNDKIGEDIDYVKFTLPSGSQGTLYTNYPQSTVSSSTGYSLTALGNIVFVPNRSYSGTVNVAYKAYDDDGNEFTGIVEIVVTAETFAVAAQTATIKQTETLLLKDTNIASAFSTAASGNALDSIRLILPDSSQGTLYRNYVSSSNPGTAVAEGAEYSLTEYNTISFVPKSTYTGTSIIYYTGEDAGSNNILNGKLTVTIQTAGIAEIALSVVQDEVLVFSGAAFNTKFKAAAGSDLSYVQFTLPSSANGVLYYNYSSASSLGTAVKATDKYYRTGTNKLLDDVVFVPKSTYAGTFTLNYKGYTSGGDEYPGTVRITVTASSSDLGTLTYSMDQGGELLLSATDVNTVFKAETGSSFSYVKFTLPSSTYGILYYDYTSSGTYEAKVSATTKYYRSGTEGTNLLSMVSFVPKSTYTGIFVINYTAYDSSNNDYTGKIQVNVKSAAQTDLKLLSYSIDQGETLTFSTTDFNNKFKEAADDLSFSYVQFTLPSSTYGLLYYDYTSSSDPGTAVKASDKYYRTGTTNKLLSEVTYVPKSTYKGTWLLSYTAYDSSGTGYSGKVSVSVGVEDPTVLAYTITNTGVLTFSDTAINTAFKAMSGTNFTYLTFSLPSTTAGKLYYKYESSDDVGTAVTSSSKYYRSSTPYVYNVSFVPKATYVGTFELDYTAYDSSGNDYDGVIKITVTAANPLNSAYFRDVQNHWAASYIDYLFEEGIVKGITATTYGPASNITRGDFMLMLYRAFNLKGSTAVNFSDVPKGSYYYDAIATAKILGIAQGDASGQYQPNASVTRQDAIALLYRTMTASGQSIIGNTSLLTKFSDRGSIASYAQVAIAAMISKGVIDGYPNGTFKPAGYMTRAEMAAVLYKVDNL
jgi:trimeric autotransporter adhesin